jgi:hypothetical protein
MSEIRGRTKRETQSMSTHTSSARHYCAKPIEVREELFQIALEAPDASCRAVADRFNEPLNH